MSESLIINARDQLSWRRRLASDALTALLWLGWLYLLQPLSAAVDWVQGWGPVLHPATLRTLMGGPATPQGLMALLGAAAVLLLWSRLPSRRPVLPPDTTVAGDSRHFGLDEVALADGRAASVVVVHHDEQGYIKRVEIRQTRH